MVVLGLVFVLHFSVSVAALAVPRDKQAALAASGWCRLAAGDKNTVQNHFKCNGFGNSSSAWDNPDPCMAAGDECGGCAAPCSSGACPACYPFLETQIRTLLHRGGGVALALAFPDLLGLWAAHLFRQANRGTQGYNREFL